MGQQVRCGMCEKEQSGLWPEPQKTELTFSEVGQIERGMVFVLKGDCF